ncbi:MAG: hypothetical protein CMF55_05310 [Legionellales bacterium]|nr:hypothetical protein [Legionellales bacterium]HAG62086.1 hypothetical protein [Coxiellaceae bacterium]
MKHRIQKPINTSYTIGFIMAVIAGFSDVFGFIALHQIFTAHITGNIVMAISYAIYHIPGISPRLIAIPTFVIFAIIATIIIETHGISKFAFRIWLAIELLLFLLLMYLGIDYRDHFVVTTNTFTIIAMLPVTAMAIHNTLMKTYLRGIPVFTVMTGNLSQLIISATSLSLGKKNIQPEHRLQRIQEIKKVGNIILGFITGGLISTTYAYADFYAISLLIPFFIAGIVIA